jgi:hypothetical protein
MTTNKMMNAPMSGLLLVALCALATPAQAFVANGSFETGSFSDWSTLSTGNQVVVDNPAICGSAFPCSGAPTNGTSEALLRTPGTANVSSLETFLGLTPGSLISRNVAGGSAISQTFTLATAGTLSFDWNFLTNETLRSTAPNDDFASYFLNAASGFTVCSLAPPGSPVRTCTISPSGFGGSPVSVEASLGNTLGSNLVLSSTGLFNKDTGFNSASLSLSAGTYTLNFLVADSNDTAAQSGLLVDNVGFQPIPEPATTSWLAAFLALGVSAQFRRGQSTVHRTTKQS